MALVIAQEKKNFILSIDAISNLCQGDAVKDKTPLEKKMVSMKPRQVIKVKTHKERAEAHRISMRLGLNITTRAMLLKSGYEIVRNY